MKKMMTLFGIIAFAAIIMCVVPTCKENDVPSTNDTGTGNGGTGSGPGSGPGSGSGPGTSDGTGTGTAIDPPSSQAAYPPGYPKSLQMSNPLFWQFPSEMVNQAGALAGTTGRLYTADPSARVWNINGEDILFVYASHDMEVFAGCDRMDRYHVFSTTDMQTWTDYGEIIKADDVPWKTGPFDNGSKFMWAPDCVYKDGTFYYYFPTPSKNTSGAGNSWGENWKVGIATSEHPASNFTILNEPLKGIGTEIDPHVFIDDNGQAYFYYGGGGRAFGGRLKDNMKEIDGSLTQMTGLADFHEGIWVHKYNGTYYLSYPDNNGGGGLGNNLRYATSSNPLGPWESKGVYVYASGSSTIHGSIVKFKNKWYAFYHGDLVNNNGDQGRSVQVDELFYNNDGTIKLVNTWGTAYNNGPHNVAANSTLQAEDFNDGGETYGYHRLDAYKTPEVTHNVYRNSHVKMETAGGATYIGDIQNKEYFRYTVNAAAAGVYDVEVYAALNNNSTGKFHINVNGVNRGAGSVTNTGGWSTFTAVTVSGVPFKAGENLFEIRIENGGFNLDKFVFKGAAAYTGTPYKTHNAPGKIEAEDFDLGGENVAYHDSDGYQNNWTSYRTDNPTPTPPPTGGSFPFGTTPVVDIESSGSGGNTFYNLSWTSTGEWCKYTFTAQAGTYDVICRINSGNGNSGSLTLTFDDVDEYPPVSTQSASWGDYQEVTLSGVTLTAGTHVMKMTMGSNLNVDWYNFVKK